MLFTELPRVKFINGVSVLDRMDRLKESLGCAPIFAKRDDCISLGMGGSKVRGFEFWMGEALRLNADVIVAAGSPESNQCRLAAAASAKLGIKCVILHSAEDNSEIESNLLLSRLLGAEIHFIGCVDEIERGKIAAAFVSELRKAGHTPYLIGDPGVGTMGYISCALELSEQAAAENVKIKHVFLPGSMGTTETGFILGNALLGYPFNIHLISVEYSKAELAKIIEEFYMIAGKNLSVDLPSLAWDTNVHIYEQYLGGGYAVPTPESLNAIKIAASLEGIFLENTYTSKTFAGMIDLLQHDTIFKEEASCFIHTGGTPTVFSSNNPIVNILKTETKY